MGDVYIYFGVYVVKVVKEERDLGVIVHKSLKPTSQCIEAVKSANKILGTISRTFMFKDKNSMLKSLIRPKLENSIQAWRPYLRKDIDLLEKVERRATKLMFRDKSVGYYKRLRYLLFRFNNFRDTATQG